MPTVLLSWRLLTKGCLVSDKCFQLYRVFHSLFATLLIRAILALIHDCVVCSRPATWIGPSIQENPIWRRCFSQCSVFFSFTMTVTKYLINENWQVIYYQHERRCQWRYDKNADEYASRWRWRCPLFPQRDKIRPIYFNFILVSTSWITRTFVFLNMQLYAH